mmetsp:Transcript_28103/g.24835  ORF Transcript_28103/g.24835 Transcript_28103/m.24835 type:complete len:170 (+) Transcript_28103:29-538(+)
MSNSNVAPPELTDKYYKYSNPKAQVNISETFRINNPTLCDTHGKNYDTYSYEDELQQAYFYGKREASMSHGYPLTFVLQGGIFLATALYTARAQGLPSPHLFYKSHWFDWITCFRRFAVFGIAGGLIAGTLLFGDPHVAVKRVYNRYNRLCFTDPSSYAQGYQIPFTNK